MGHLFSINSSFYFPDVFNFLSLIPISGDKELPWPPLFEWLHQHKESSGVCEGWPLIAVRSPLLCRHQRPACVKWLLKAYGSFGIPPGSQCPVLMWFGGHQSGWHCERLPCPSGVVAWHWKRQFRWGYVGWQVSKAIKRCSLNWIVGVWLFKQRTFTTNFVTKKRKIEFFFCHFWLK